LKDAIEHVIIALLICIALCMARVENHRNLFAYCSLCDVITYTCHVTKQLILLGNDDIV